MRFHIIKKSAAVLTAFVLFSTSVLAAELTITEKYDFDIAKGTSYTSFKGTTESAKPQTGYYINYDPSDTISPVVVYGNKVYGGSPMTWALNWAKENGQTIMAAINADFFSLQTGLPLGLVVRNGALKSSDSGNNALGFLKDGTAVIGKPELKITMDTPYGEVLVDHLNKLRQPYGLYLLTEDFSDGSKVTTLGTDILFKIEEEKNIKIGQSITLTVADTMTSDFSVAIPAGYCLLTVDNNGPISRLPAFKVGDTVTLNVKASDPRFDNVVQAVGGGDMLIKDGVVQNFTGVDAHPRSAVGVKSNGEVILYEVDGRQTGYSVGLTLSQLAGELFSLGCIDAINLDGGGSSIISARRPGDDNLTVLNRPSDGKQRNVANYIMLVNSAPKSDVAKRLFCYPDNPIMFINSNINYVIKATDENFYPLAVPSDAEIIASETGSVTSAGVFTSGTVASEKSVKLKSKTASGTWNVKVVDKLTSIKAITAGSYLSSLDLSLGQMLDIDVEAYIGNSKIISSDSAFEWTLSPSVGTVDKNGVITASSTNGAAGTLTISGGDVSISLPVNVGQLPQVLADFENSDYLSAYLPVTGQITAAAAPISRVKYGKGALSLKYDFTSGSVASISTPITFKYKDFLNLWIYGDGSNNKLIAKFALDMTLSAAAQQSSPESAAESQIPESFAEAVIAERLDFTGWRNISIPLPKNAVAVSEFILTKTDGGAINGEIAMDNIIASAEVEFSDFTPPVISDITLSSDNSDADEGANEQEPEPSALLPDKVNISFAVTDNAGRPLSLKNIKVNVDGNPINIAYNEGAGEVTAAAELNNLTLHVISVQCADFFGNIAKKSVIVPSGEQNTPFFDMELNWAKDFAGFMYNKGFMQGELYGELRKFSPNRSLTRAEFFVIMSRYLGFDEAQYADVVLPFTDLDSIPIWAVGAVKALYSNQLLSGRQVNGKLIFDPSAVITREEAMTALSNLLPRGFEEAEPEFSDKDKISVWAYSSVRLLTSLKVITGYTDNTLKPQNGILRCEIAKIFTVMY